jgi:zinc transport system substrate-binding protein
LTIVLNALRIVFMFMFRHARVVRALIGSSAAALLLAGCGALTGSTDGGDERVVAAFYPLAWVTGRVAGGNFEVANLTRPGGEPHDLELSIKETADIERAALVVFEHDFQPAVDAAVEQNAAGAVLDVADVVDLRPFAQHDEEGHAEEGHDEEAHDEEAHDEDHAHDHGDLDPHFWLDPLLMADVADAVADELTDLDPDHADEYAANSAQVREDLTGLDRTYADGLASCAIDTVVVNHDAFGYLARYGLHLEPIVGLSPESEPTPADLARLQDLVRGEGITTVFAESLSSPKAADSLARDLGVDVAVLDPIEGLSDDTAGEDYLSLMRQNLERLEEANRCQTR